MYRATKASANKWGWIEVFSCKKQRRTAFLKFTYCYSYTISYDVALNRSRTDFIELFAIIYCL